MPHLVILYSPDLEAESDLDALCRSLADAMVALADDAGRRVFPTGGVRGLAVPAAHAAIADGRGDYGFAYLNLRMARGRDAAVRQHVGETLAAIAQAHFAPVLARRPVGVTFQIDEGQEVFDAKSSSLHPLFQKA